MSSFQLSRLFGGQLTKMSIVTSAPLSFLLLGLQAMIDVKFSCPCMVWWNFVMSALIFFAPAIFALVIMLLLLRPCKHKCCYHQDKTNRGKSQGEDKSGKSQGEDKRRTSQSKENDPVEDLNCCKAFFVCTIPCFVWICIFFIDGDYLACGFTNWTGHYACDKELHPNCLNWCKPNEMSQGTTEYEYERTRELIRISKTTGYALAIIFSIVAIIVVIYCDCCKSEKSTCCGAADPESQSHRQQGPGTENQQRNDKPENAFEEDRLMGTQ